VNRCSSVRGDDINTDCLCSYIFSKPGRWVGTGKVWPLINEISSDQVDSIWHAVLADSEITDFVILRSGRNPIRQLHPWFDSFQQVHFHVLTFTVADRDDYVCIFTLLASLSHCDFSHMIVYYRYMYLSYVPLMLRATVKYCGLHIICTHICC
jgi:hypothetical protein